MPGYRPERVAEMIHRELGARLISDVKDPRVTPISIVNVSVNRDLSRALVAYLPLGGGEGTEDLAEGLAHAARQLRGPIGRALRLRHAPELVFELDKQTETAFRVTALLDKLKAERGLADAEDDAQGDAADEVGSEGEE